MSFPPWLVFPGSWVENELVKFRESQTHSPECLAGQEVSLGCYNWLDGVGATP
jgi:hypothetical protein